MYIYIFIYLGQLCIANITGELQALNHLQNKKSYIQSNTVSYDILKIILNVELIPSKCNVQTRV